MPTPTMGSEGLKPRPMPTSELSGRPVRQRSRHTSRALFEARMGRRSAVVLDAAVLEDLQKANRRFLRRCTWPFSDPNGRPRQCWNLAASCLLALQLLYLPFQSAFVTPMDLEDPIVSTLASLLILIDLFWLFDIVLNFTTGVRDSVQVLHYDVKSIASAYMKRWFWVDLFATVPSLAIHILVAASPEPDIPRIIWWLSLSPMLRAPRLWTSIGTLRRMEAHLKSSWLSSVAALVELFMLPVVFSHISACALWALGRRNLEADPAVPSWIKLGIDLTDAPGALQAVPIGERYMTALYFAVTVMSTVGLGDINMNLSNERGLLCLIMATTSLVVGVAVNGVATIVSKLNERTAVTNEQLAKVSRFLKAYSVPGDLQRRVHSYLLQFFENQEREDTKSLLLLWLKKSEYLRVNVNLALTGNCLARHPLIRLIPRDVLVNVCDICDMEFHPPGQELMTAGVEMRNCLYIRRGVVQTRFDLKARRDKQSRMSPEASKEPLDFAHLFQGTDDDSEDIDEIQREIEATDLRRPEQEFRAGSFIGDFRLFLGTNRSWKTATCLSFCELISLDVEKFRALMIQQSPEVFDILVIYSSIDHDCPNVLLRVLEEQSLSPEDALLFGEGVLHHCAKKNASNCANHLLEELSADVAVLDAQGKTPSQVASKLKHKEVFWSIIRHGGQATDEDVLPAEAYSVRAKNKLKKVKIRPALTDFLDEDTKNSTEVRELLEDHGVNVAEFGREGRKSLEHLVEELNLCQSELVLTQGKVLRRVQLVRLRLLAIVDNHARALVELQNETWMRAPDQKLAKLPSRRVLRTQTVDQATQDLILNLGVPPELLEEKKLVVLAKSTHTETKASMSYPGLDTEYIIHESTMKVRSQALDRAEAIGLPQGRAFERDLPVSALACVTRQFFWPILVKMRLDAQQGDWAKTEELKRHWEQSERRSSTEIDSSTVFGRFNPLRFQLRNPKGEARVIDVGAK